MGRDGFPHSIPAAVPGMQLPAGAEPLSEQGRSYLRQPPPRLEAVGPTLALVRRKGSLL